MVFNFKKKKNHGCYFTRADGRCKKLPYASHWDRKRASRLDSVGVKKNGTPCGIYLHHSERWCKIQNFQNDILEIASYVCYNDVKYQYNLLHIIGNTK
jgi:hypothetical protein